VTPRVIVGTSSLGSVVPLGPPDPRALRYLDEIFEVGCRAFDLAASYQVGGTERLFGAWIASRKNRDQLFLITKGAHPFPIVAPHRLTPRAIEDDLDASLRRLRTDRVDLYLLHRDDEGAPLEPVVALLAKRRARGDILAWGVSNFALGRLEAIDALARAAGERVAASSTHFSLYGWSRPPFPGSVSVAGDRAALAFHARTSMPLLAWSPLGAGFATGRATRVYDHAENRARRERARKMARERGVSPAQIALAYVLSQPFPARVIVASGAAARMRENLGAVDVHLDAADLRWLATAETAV